MGELHARAEVFVSCALADETCNYCEKHREVGLFVLRLIREDKKRQSKAAFLERMKSKIGQAVVLNVRAHQEARY